MKSNAIARLRESTAIESTINKLQAKSMAKVQLRAIELPKFRYLDDVTRFLSDMAKEVDENAQLIKVYQTQLAHLKNPKSELVATLVKAADLEFTIGPSSTKKSYLKRKIDPDLTKIVLPSAKKLDELKKQYILSEDLYEKHRTLEAVESQIAMQFPDRRGEAYTNAMSALGVLKKKVADQLKTVLGFLNEVAAKHVPKTFTKYIEAVCQEVQEHVIFEKYQLFLYVSTTPEKELVFTYYLMLSNAVNDEGKVTPSLYISVQWVVTQSVHVQINPEYELPGQLLKEGGTEVGSVGEAVKAIADLLTLEEFATSLGTVPLSTQLRKPIDELDPQMFSYRNFIQKLDVSSDKLVFILREDVTDDQAKEIAYSLYQEVKALFKNSKGAKLRMKPSTKQIEFEVVNVAKGSEVNTHDAEFLADKFGLNQAQLRKVVDILNNGKGAKNET